MSWEGLSIRQLSLWVPVLLGNAQHAVYAVLFLRLGRALGEQIAAVQWGAMPPAHRLQGVPCPSAHLTAERHSVPFPSHPPRGAQLARHRYLVSPPASSAVAVEPAEELDHTPYSTNGAGLHAA